jgi:hypothetical protein
MPNVNQGPINASRRALENFQRDVGENRSGRKFEPISPDNKRSPQGNQFRANQRSVSGFMETKNAIQTSQLSASEKAKQTTRGAMDRYMNNLRNINNM